MFREITFHPDEELIRKAQEKAARESTSLNELFRAWLWQYVNADVRAGRFDALMHSMGHVHAGRALSRDEMNER